MSDVRFYATVDGDGVSTSRAAFSFPRGRTIVLEWGIEYGERGEPRYCAGFSPSPLHAARKLRSLRPIFSSAAGPTLSVVVSGGKLPEEHMRAVEEWIRAHAHDRVGHVSLELRAVESLSPQALVSLIERGLRP